MFYYPIAEGTARSQNCSFCLIFTNKKKSKISLCFQGKDLIVSYHQLLGIPGKEQLLCLFTKRASKLPQESGSAVVG